LPTSEAFFTSLLRSVIKASCRSMSFLVPSRPPGPGWPRPGQQTRAWRWFYVA
jgi:hypothetical protein